MQLPPFKYPFFPSNFINFPIITPQEKELLILFFCQYDAYLNKTRGDRAQMHDHEFFGFPRQILQESKKRGYSGTNDVEKEIIYLTTK